ncbi:glycosyltransferase [Natrinema gelatinilyticum]|uniref:glycosyltransferase n=1 Tax=Natrinema gelatinilyticum TaxID=2961571 RepID=UPI0020C32801|nr:glycosyltransferase [Natrinema gelatinilyticum]
MNGEDMFETVNVDYFRSSSNPDITVVVPTIPSSSHEQVCKHIVNQDFDGEFEAFAVNDAKVDLCEARNAGLHHASADIVAYTDDDCIPTDNWLKSIQSQFDEQVVCVEGSVEGGINYQGRRKYVGCNLAVRTSEAIDIGGFRSEFDGWRDDTEFGWRMERDSKGKCVFSTDAHIVHPTRPRATLIESNEKRLKEEYPIRYNEIINNSLLSISYRKLQKYGVINRINKIRYEDG